MSAIDAVGMLEPVFNTMVTATPGQHKFTANGITRDLNANGWTVTTPQVSFWLQEYRDVQGGKRPRVEAKYVVATYNRGRHSEWLILVWPGMDEATAAELTADHEIFSFVREDVKPMLRNVEVQFLPSTMQNQTVKRGQKPIIIGKLNGYQTTLLSFRDDFRRVRPVVLRASVAPLVAVLDTTIDEVDRVKLMVQAA